MEVARPVLALRDAVLVLGPVRAGQGDDAPIGVGKELKRLGSVVENQGARLGHVQSESPVN